MSLLACHEPDGAGAAELAIQLRVAARQAVLTQVGVVFTAVEARSSVGVIDAGRHSGSLVYWLALGHTERCGHAFAT